MIRFVKIPKKFDFAAVSRRPPALPPAAHPAVTEDGLGPSCLSGYPFRTGARKGGGAGGAGGGRAAVRASLCPRTPLSGGPAHLTSLPSFALGAEWGALSFSLERTHTQTRVLALRHFWRFYLLFFMLKFSLFELKYLSLMFVTCFDVFVL